MSKQITLFSSLMQSLSHHLRPAPYPYGLLTLRLLGKLGGKNRQFLRDPMQLSSWKVIETSFSFPLVYPISLPDDSMSDSAEPLLLSLPVPLSSCVDTIRSIALTHVYDELLDDEGEELDDETDSRIDPSTLLGRQIDKFDIVSYSKDIINDLKKNQSLAGMMVLRAAIQVRFGGDDPMDMNNKICSPDHAPEKLICRGLLYACMNDSTKLEATALLQDLVLKFDCSVVAECLTSLLSEPSSLATKIGLDFLMYLLGLIGNDDPACSNSLLFDALIRSLCEKYCSVSWGKQSGLRQGIVKMTSALGSEWSRMYEVSLVNATLLAVKSVPRELSEAAINALSGFISVCITLYGDRWHHLDPDDNVVWDILAVVGVAPGGSCPTAPTSTNHRPCEDVFKIVIYEITSQQQLVR
jgi:transformation/transcription domain-associated protein